MNKQDRQILDVTTILFAIATGGALVFAESLPIISGIGVAAILLIALLGLISRDAPVETEDVDVKAQGFVPWPRERLAALAHEQWSRWMRYLFKQGTFNTDGTWTMPAWAVERWQRQIDTPYHRLSDEEQASDLAEADRVIALLLRERGK